MKKQTSYKLGYAPKIAYHITQNNRDKVQYFLGQHVRKYGELNVVEMTYIAEYLKDSGIDSLKLNLYYLNCLK